MRPDRDQRQSAVTVILRWLLCGLAALTIASEVRAHNLGESYLYLQVYENSISGRFEIALSDLNRALGLAGTDRRITKRNLDQHIPFLRDYYLQRVSIFDAGQPLSIEFKEHGFLSARGGYALLPFDLVGFEAMPAVLTIDYAVLFQEEPTHRGFLLIEHNWATGTFANENQISLVFGPGSERQDYDLTSKGRWRGFVAVVDLGIEHIWMGIDHVMFLIALLLPSVLRRDNGSWVPVDRFGPALINVVKIVTSFTVAHSLTLSLAALGVIDLPSTLVEVIIAISIAVAAADIIIPIFRGRIWVVVFGFGLFHGFGFAGALSEMGVLGENLGLSLFAFNLGVEIGQVVIVAIIFPVLYLLRRQKLYLKPALPAAAVFMILVSFAWATERAFGINFHMTDRVMSVIERVVK